MKKLLILLLLSSNVFSQVHNGQLISADKFNSSTSHIGEVKSSILTVPQFQSLYGNCWRLMDGSSLAGTDLGNLTQKSNLPNAITEGGILKQINGARQLGSYEADDIKQHAHGVSDPGHRHIEGTNAVNNNLRYGSTNAELSNRRSESGSGTNFASFTQTVATGVSIQNTGILENRVKSTGVNMFIKVNNDCSL